MKRTLKKLSGLLLALCLLLSLLPMTVLAADPSLPVSGTDWTLGENRVLTIESNDGMNDWLTNVNGDFNYNGSVNSVVVSGTTTDIKDGAFQNRTNITSVTLGDSVKTIGERAFLGLTGLTSLTIPASVETIGASAFNGCTNLEYVAFKGTTVPSFGSTAFDMTGTPDIYVPLASLDNYKTALTSYTSYIFPIIVAITNSSTTYYLSLKDALIAAADGDTVTLLSDITACATYTGTAGKTITIDGQNHKVTGAVEDDSVALKLSGAGTVILKNLTLQGGTSNLQPTAQDGSSTGLQVEGGLDVRSLGTVEVNGGKAFESYGLYNTSAGTVDVTTASGSGDTSTSDGVANYGVGTVNVGTAKGSGYAVSNQSSGTVNVMKAQALYVAVFNQSTGTINVTTADAIRGVINGSTGTVNVTTTSGALYGNAVTNENGTVNAGTITGTGTVSGTANTDIASVTLNKGTGASCVLDSITVAASGDTTVGTLPSVYKDGAYSNTWYTDSAKTTVLSGPVTGATTLYSSFYTVPVTPPIVGGVGGSSTPSPTATVSGSTATTTVTGTTSGGTQTVPVTGDTMVSLTDAAKTAEATGNTPVAEINTGTNSGLTSVGVTIPGTQFDTFASGTNAALQIASGIATVTFSADAVDAIGAAGSGDVTFDIGTVDTSTLTAEQQSAVGSRPVFSFSVTVGGTAVSEFGSSVTVSVPYTPQDGEDANAIVVYYVDASGNLQPMIGAYDAATGTVTFETTHFSDYVIGYNKISFTDVADTDWYANAVTFIAARGITGGTTATSYAPNVTLTRGQFIVMLMRAYGILPDSNPTNNFADAGDTYYTPYLAAAKRLVISEGVGDNMFAPEQVITRQEMFTLLYNSLAVIDKLPSGASGTTIADFADASTIASWAQGAMVLLVKTGTVSGNDGKLSPEDTATRAEMAQMLYNLLQQ